MNRHHHFSALGSLFFLLLMLMLASCQDQYRELDLEKYHFRDTKELLKFVYNSAKYFEQNGLASLDDFRNDGSLRANENYYIYIYQMDGTNIFHAGMPHLEGNNLQEIVDINGKKISYLVQEALQNENNPHAWVHYTWWTPGKFYPVPKSSCHFQVSTAAGKQYFVGGGLDFPHEETEFIRIAVDSAVEEISRKGWKALEDISDPLSQFGYREVRVFAFQQDGKILISPVIGENLPDFDLLNCADEVGHKPFLKGLKNLQEKDRTWEVFLAKSRYERVPVKKSLYLRKVMIGAETIFLGAITDLPQPPWTG